MLTARENGKKGGRPKNEIAKTKAQDIIIDAIQMAFSRLSDSDMPESEKIAVRVYLDREFRHIKKRYGFEPGINQRGV